MKKRILSLALVFALIVAMSIPASAYNVTMSRCWNGVYYATNDTCYIGQFRCVIESDSADHTLRTAVDVHKTDGAVSFFYGNAATLISIHNQNVSGTIKHILCTHYIGSDAASTQKVYPG